MNPLKRTSFKNHPFNAEEIARRICEVFLEKKGFEIILLNLSELSPVTDFFVLSSATTDVHARALADHVMESLEREGVEPWHLEGYSHGRWILIDYVDVVVHIFVEESRKYYGLERLWGDAPFFRFDETESDHEDPQKKG